MDHIPLHQFQLDNTLTLNTTSTTTIDNNNNNNNTYFNLANNLSLLTPSSSSSSTTTTITTTASPSRGNTNPAGAQQQPLSRYENQKRRDWNTFGQYLRSHRPPLTLSRCSGAHVLEFLKYLDQFGKTKVHCPTCPMFGNPSQPGLAFPSCPCPLKQAWGSLDALIGRLRAAYDENNGGPPENNPFGARAVRLYLREVREMQAKARGISYDKKKRKKNISLK